MRQAAFAAVTNHNQAQSVNSGWAFFVSRETRNRITKKGETTMANQTNGNQFRDDEILVLDQLRDGKWVKNIFPKIGVTRAVIVGRVPFFWSRRYEIHEIRLLSPPPPGILTGKIILGV
jgi:hypothetical protein